MRRRRGFSLVEALVAVSVLGLLLTCVLVLYISGAQAWARADAQSDLLQNLQVPVSQIARGLERTSYDSLSVDGAALSFLSPGDPSTGYALHTDGRLKWQRYQVFYFDGNSLFRRSVDLAPGSPQETAPSPIDNYDPGTGANPLSLYCSEGNVIARSLKEFEVQLLDDQHTLKVRLLAERPRYGRPKPEVMELISTIYIP